MSQQWAVSSQQRVSISSQQSQLPWYCFYKVKDRSQASQLSRLVTRSRKEPRPNIWNYSSKLKNLFFSIYFPLVSHLSIIYDLVVCCFCYLYENWTLHAWLYFIALTTTYIALILWLFKWWFFFINFVKNFILTLTTIQIILIPVLYFDYSIIYYLAYLFFFYI